MEDVSVLKLKKIKKCSVKKVQMLGDNAVLAFSAFSGVQLPTAIGSSHCRVVVLVYHLLVVYVAQLDGPWDGLTQEVTLILGFRGWRAGGARVVIVILIPGVLAQSSASVGCGVLQTKIWSGPGALPEELGLVSSLSSSSKLAPGTPGWWEAIVIFSHTKLWSVLGSHSPISHQI